MVKETWKGDGHVGEGSQNISFLAFVAACVHGEVVGRMTYEEWVRDKTVLAPLRYEYLDWVYKGVTESTPEYRHFHGNFYDWLVQKGIKLTPEESAKRSSKESN